MLKNSQTRWGGIAKLFHWGIAILILIEVPAGFIMGRTYGAKDPVLAAWQFWTSHFHHTAGMMLLLFAFARVIWRLASPGPEPASSLSSLERVAAKGTHWLIYALLFLIPLSGWAALSSLADTPEFGAAHLWFFGTDGFGPDGFIPRIVPPVPWNGTDFLRYGLFSAAHRWLLIAGAVLLTLHILAALRHHFVLSDATLKRMLPGRGPDDD